MARSPPREAEGGIHHATRPLPHHVWKPLLHEVASRSLDSEVDAIEFIPHAVNHGYRYRIGAMVGIDREKRQIYVEPSYDEEGQEIIPRRVMDTTP